MCEAKAVLKRVLSVCALLGALFLSLNLYKALVRPQAFLHTASPGGTYSVHVTGQKDRPYLPFVQHEVRFSATKHAEDFLSDKYLHSGDWSDPSFEMLYPQHTWVNDSVLHFYKQEYFDSGTPESIVVVNQTNRLINYLKVTSVDSFLLFSVQPESAAKLITSPPRGDFTWVSAEGEFSGGQLIKRDGAGFIVPAR